VDVHAAKRGGLSGCCRRRHLRRFTQPEHTSRDDQEDRNQLRARHGAAKNFATPWIVAQEFQEVPSEAVEEEISSNDLAIKLLFVQ
jgi:hypothetical protein